jgi:hypothetical protein
MQRAAASRLRAVLVAAAAAAALVGAAAATVTQAGCDQPARYVPDGAGYQLVGGCLQAGDVPVAPHHPEAQNPNAPQVHSAGQPGMLVRP